jgi:DNA uptake protein ComE-like DNA-binding protein
MKRARASVLVGLLWCLALLSLVVVGVLHSARIDLRVVKNQGDRMQAHYLALAGIEKAKALLYQDARERSRSGRNHSGALYNAPEQFHDLPLGRGRFRVLRRGSLDEGGGILYGVSDEESRLNVNTASAEELGKLDALTPDIAAAIVDWRDADNAVTPNGAEADYYLSLRPPHRPRNGPLQTIRELLMVRGVSRELLLGRDVRANGMLETEDEAGNESAGASADTGWASLLTVDSSVSNLSAAGAERVDIQSADEAALTRVKGISAEIARAIIAHRNQNRFVSVADLLEVAAAQNPNPTAARANPVPAQPGPGRSAAPANLPASNNAAPNPTGPKVVSEDRLLEIADDLTVGADEDVAGAVNLNSASSEVLACLPGLTRELAQAIVSYRQSSGFLPNVAWLLKVPGITREIFRQLAPRVTVRSETFRLLSEGKVTATGARACIFAIVRVGLHEVKTVSYREDDL